MVWIIAVSRTVRPLRWVRPAAPPAEAASSRTQPSSGVFDGPHPPEPAWPGQWACLKYV